MDKAEYKRAFDSVHAPDDTEERVLNALSRRPKGVQRKLTLVLCAVLILTCSAALATGTAGQWLETIISLNGSELPDGNLQEINRSAEHNGMRLTLDSVAVDGVHTYFLLDIEALDGQDLSNTAPSSIPMEDSLYLDFDLSLPSSGGYGARTLRIDDGSDPARAQLVLKVDFGVPRNGDRICLTVECLKRGFWTTDEKGIRDFELEPLAEGEWSFSFRLNRNLDGVHYTFPDHDFDISISPLGLAVNGVGSGRFGGECFLLMQDGSKVELTGGGYSGGKRNGVVCHELISYEFTELIDPSQASALVFSGTEYPLIPAK